MRSVEYWITRARSRDPEAVEWLCRHFRRRLVDYVSQRSSARVKRWCSPDDIVQNVLFEVIPRIPSIDGDVTEADISARLYQTANSRIFDAARKYRRESGESVVGSLRPEPLAEPPSSGSVTRDDELKWVFQLVDQLPTKYTDVVRLCALEGMTFVEGARHLGLSEDAVRKRYHRARDRLADKLGQRRRE